MAIPLTTATLKSLQELSIEPNLSIKIEGYDTIFSAIPVKDFLLYGCPDVFFGDPDTFYGGLKEVENNKTYIDSQTTTYSVKQQMNYDEGNASSISSMTIGLVDKNGEISQLISPGFDIEDMLGRKIQVYATFGDVSFFEDALLIFRGFVTKIDSTAGLIKFKINHPDNKKQLKLFKTVETKLNGAVNASQTTLTVDDASTFINQQGALSAYIRIDDELIQYTGTTGTTFTGLTRGALGSTAVGHDDNSQVRALYSLEGNPLDLALSLMMSGFGTDPMHENIPVTSFLKVGAGTTQISNAIYFDQLNIIEQYGMRIGDTITTTGAANGANNVTTRTITDVQSFDSGYYIVVDGADLVLENTTSAVISMFGQYNTLPDGMKMTADEVDIDEHIKIRDFFHSATQMRLYMKGDEIEGKEFLDKQLYQPIACYSLPRKSQSSVGFTVGPIPGEDIKTIDISNATNGRQLTVSRTTNRSFFNEVVYKYDDDPLNTEEKFNSGQIFISLTSKNRIPGTTKTYVVESTGLRTDLNGVNLITSNATRILDRYKFGAEMFTMKMLFSESAGIEIGDIVVGEFVDLKVTDITQGNRQFKPRLLEVHNKGTNYKTGIVDITALDTGINIDTRFGLISPCSPIAGLISSSQFVIGPDATYPSKFGDDEYLKWTNVISISNPISIRVHNADYSVDEDLVVTDINENTFTLQDQATITLAVGLMVEFTGYVDTDTSDNKN